MKRTNSFAMIFIMLLFGIGEALYADLLTFDAQQTQGYEVPTPIYEGDYVFQSNFYGLGTFYNSFFFPNNGTKHLLSWSNWANPNGTSGFTLTHRLGVPFEITSFDFAGGQFNVSGFGVSSLAVTGYRGGSIIESDVFHPIVDFNGDGPGQTLRTINLNGFSGIDQLVVQAFQNNAPFYNNSASYDNFALSAVPEPSSLAFVSACTAIVATSLGRGRRQ